MYHVRYSKRYKKSLRKLHRSGRHNDIVQLEKIVGMLERGKKLPKKHLDHALSGELRGHRECHIRPDLLLLYYKHDDVLVLVLVDVGSHSELFQ